MTPWVETNLQILSDSYPELEALVDGEVQWVRIPTYPVPSDIWTTESVAVAFRIPNNAGEAPYAFWVHPGLVLKSGATAVGNYNFPSPTPWGSDWGQFSYAPEEPWTPKVDVRSGVNMLDFARGIAGRLREGA